MARRKPGDWNTRKKRNFKRKLHEQQEGICPFCNWYFDITRLQFWYNHNESTYYLVCAGCHP